MIRYLFLAAVIAVAPAVAPAGAAGGPDAAATVLYLLRHAEKTAPPYEHDPPDPALTGAGRERAERLARLLSAENITRVFSTDFMRTRDTVRPLAEQLGLDVELYDPRALEGFAKRLRNLPGRHVIVGHSNTTPRLVELLGGEGGRPIDESSEFDRLYIVILRGDGGATTVRLRYGRSADQPSPVSHGWLP